MRFHYRAPEVTELVYFFYLCGLALVLRDRPHADFRVLAVAAAVTAIVSTLALLEGRPHAEAFSITRDWVTLGVVLAAYRTLDLFSPTQYLTGLEFAWNNTDHLVLNKWGLRALVEYFGGFVPSYLEICYLFTSGAGCYALALLYLYRKRNRADQFLLIYVLGTLISYALVPLLRLQPPRIAFPDAIPMIPLAVRKINLVVLSGAGIHAGVFPSAHVSSTFAAAWGMFRSLPERRRYGWIFLIYAISVAVATVYGRYHYAVDSVAGIGVSAIAVGAAVWIERRLKQS